MTRTQKHPGLTRIIYSTSLAFGILFATAVTLVMVSANILIVEDIKNFIRNISNGVFGGSTSPASPQERSR